ncbi:hypothetical protein [Gimibacter soli]|uniref:Uncharacterized protein n=1 Tax=Gimibacter soli TaxID=3024400 RepID=A0AAE9XV99_9PROT|nr:hypothetical protein [Gimibacter soli]WCL54408.1 hypothetical protein PH603_01375 [Gimibacter soli]
MARDAFEREYDKLQKTLNTSKGLITILTDEHSASAFNTSGEKVGEIICGECCVRLDAMGEPQYELLLTSANVDQMYRRLGIAEACVEAICETSGQIIFANMDAYMPQSDGSHLTSDGKAFAYKMIKKGKMNRMTSDDVDS